MPHSFSYAVSMNLEHSIKEGSHERYPDHFQCFRNIKKIKYPDFQAMTYVNKKLLGKTNVTNENTGISRGKVEKHREYINMSLSNLIIVYIV